MFSHLKTWLRGIHHGVSPQHLAAPILTNLPRRQTDTSALLTPSARHSASQAMSWLRLMPSFIPQNHKTLHLVGVCDNRISTDWTMGMAVSSTATQSQAVVGAENSITRHHWRHRHSTDMLLVCFLQNEIRCVAGTSPEKSAQESVHQTSHAQTARLHVDVTCESCRVSCH